LRRVHSNIGPTKLEELRWRIEFQESSYYERLQFCINQGMEITEALKAKLLEGLTGEYAFSLAKGTRESIMSVLERNSRVFSTEKTATADMAVKLFREIKTTPAVESRKVDWKDGLRDLNFTAPSSTSALPWPGSKPRGLQIVIHVSSTTNDRDRLQQLYKLQVSSKMQKSA